MEETGEQLHPNWRALATVHIPLKRFIKEGSHGQQQGTLNSSQQKYEVTGIDGDDIKEFYQELVKTEKTNNQTRKDLNTNQVKSPPQPTKPNPSKTPFEVRKYFRFALENKVEELKKMEFKGKNINACDNYGWTALMMASCEGSYEAVKYLLSLGVDRNIKDKSGKTAKDLAYKKGYHKIIELLEKEENEEINKNCELAKIETIEPFFCEICKQNFKETSQVKHQTSTIHQFNMKSNLPLNKLQKFNIPARNKGLQLMVKQGWDKESGLGPSQAGRLYPVKTVIRKQRTGLGIEQESARVTHFEAYDLKAVQRHNSDYYRKQPRNRNDIRREKVREWKRDRRLRNELN
ncbi:G patch domain and ankyrin repeat-containing protein 1 homolog [Lucilia sericata]|uniref:G patch domain and ankyrin repeat-containing protein 1 homolog n=1 Tax=Lucilia sericata TaxID=13632 RepID=UPI0018A87915|nr:G patch domain and ankyrin repeat-containing protein 1 homolog [Lucilia sericata]